MIHISGRIHGLKKEIGFEEKSLPLSVNSCGYQKFITKDYSIERPGGRVDYLIIYVAEGSGFFQKDGEKVKAGAGNILLYRPSEPQHYEYYAADKPVIYWVHFTGNELESILEKFRIHSGYVGSSSRITAIFAEMIQELQLKKEFYKDITQALLYRLLCLFGRADGENMVFKGESRRLEELIIILNQEYGDEWSLGKMAGQCRMSESYFSHLFKKNMKVAPMQYLTNLRIKKARELLLDSSMHVSEVAEIVGFEDPMYFSRIFKKYNGISPKKYQKTGYVFSDQEQYYPDLEQ